MCVYDPEGVVDFRERRQKEHPGAIVFRDIDDLRLIKGIGPATAEMLKEYLTFPTTQVTTKP